MPELLTERLGLIKPNRDTNTPLDIERLNLNMDTLDRATGATNVADGVIPPTVELYDGKIVREKGTGRVWMAEKQTNGSYAKKWITWPYLGTFFTSGYPFAPGAETLFGWQLFASDPGRYNLNAPASDVHGDTFWYCPMKGVWNLDMNFQFQAGSANRLSWATSRIAINGSTTDPNAGRSEDINSYCVSYCPPGADNITTHSSIQTILNAGETVLGRLQVLTDLPYITTAGIFKATMIHPF